jgi:hypothetical protein
LTNNVNSTFEKVPSDYAMLKIHTLPETGGDTVRWHFKPHISSKMTITDGGSSGLLATKSTTASLSQ